MNQIKGIIYTDDKKIIAEAEKGLTAAAVLQKYNTAFYAPCGGNGTCGKCRVWLKEDTSQNQVLACQTTVTKDCLVHLDSACVSERGRQKK